MLEPIRIPAPGGQPRIAPADGLATLGAAAPLPDGLDITTEALDDGGALVSIVINADDEAAETSFDDNLADVLPDTALSEIAQDLLDGIAADDSSRNEWIDNYNKGLGLLGLKIDEKSAGGPRQKTSTVRHPVLLWSCIKFQAQARGEILPASGPVKIRNDGNDTNIEDTKANDLEEDFNHYLTVTDEAYVPDMDRGLFYLAFGGVLYKKVYRDVLMSSTPLGMPVSRSVYAPDLIVSQDATDLQSALRVTHKIEMSKNDVERMQQSDVWRDVSLSMAQPTPTSTEAKQAQITGVQAIPQRQEDYPYTIYECYTRLDLDKYGFGEEGQGEGVAVPYRVTLDKDSRQVLEIKRNWKEGDKSFRPCKRFVMYSLIPGMGFLPYGYVHLLGNHARALTAMLRMMIDSGMFNNFPGGLRQKGLRLTTNELNPGPGEFVEMETGGQPIGNVVMPLPYKNLDASFLQLFQGLEQEAEKIAGTVEIETGDGRTNVPVGTIMAQIEQQTQVMTAVHKRMHQAQQEELILLKELFAEDPSALTVGREDVNRTWTEEDLRSANLVPASDPNVPAHVHRIMQNTLLYQLAKDNPAAFNQRNVYARILKGAVGIGDVDELLSVRLGPDGVPSPGQDQPQSGQAPTDPGIVKAANDQVSVEGAKVMAQAMKTQADASLKKSDQQLRVLEKQIEVSEAQKDRESRERIAAMNNQTTLIKEGLAQLGQQTSSDPVNDQSFGP